MQLDRRDVLFGTPVALSAVALAAESSEPVALRIDQSEMARRLGVVDVVIQGALSRFERYLPRIGALWASTGEATYEAYVGEPAAGSWTLQPSGISLRGAVAVVCPGGVSLAMGGAEFRWVAGCAFGGLTSLVYKRRSATIGLLIPGQHYGMPPGRLVTRQR